MTKKMPAHARDFSIAITSAAVGAAVEYFGDYPRLAGLAFGVALAAAGYGLEDLSREGRLHKLPLVGRFFSPAAGNRVLPLPSQDFGRSITSLNS